MAAPSSAQGSIDPVDDTLRALECFARAPLALGGVHLRGWHGPRRSALLGWLRTVCAADQPGGARGWFQLPHHTEPEQLDDGLELSDSLRLGRPVRRAGLAERMAGSIVVLQRAERASTGLSARLASEVDAGRIALVLVDESLPDEEGPWAGLLDRLGLTVDLRDEAAWRALDALAELSRDSGIRRERALAQTRKAAVRKPLVSEAAATVEMAGTRATLDERARAELCRAALLLDIPSLRPLLHATTLACLSAGQEGRALANESDLSFAVRQVLLPRARVIPSMPAAEPSTDDQSKPDPAPEPPEPPEASADSETPPPQPDQPDPPLPETSPPDTEHLPDGAAERMVETALANLPAGLLAMLASQAAHRASAARGSGSGSAANAGRGRARSIGARQARPRGRDRLHWLATLRAALPWQRLRRSQVSEGPPIRFRPDDLHVHRERRRRGCTTVFVVDASGSTALQRLAEAKGAVELLLADCYVRRDRVALVAFRGIGAELLLPPTRSLVAARRALAALPGGGGSPVAAGLELAARLSGQLARSGDDVHLVVLTDGRANLSRDGQPGRERAAAEAQAMARQLVPLAAQRVLIDTSVRPEPAAQGLADAMKARYVPMPFARARAIREAIALATR